MLESAPTVRIKLAFVRAMAATFTRASWVEAGARTGCERVVADHPRLLRPGGPDDSDYVDAVAEVVPALLGQKTYGGRVVQLTNLSELEQLVGLEEWLEENDPHLYRELYGAGMAMPAAGSANMGLPTVAEASRDATPQSSAGPSGRDPGSDRRSVFLVHGRNLAARDALGDLLRAFDLKVLDWDEASRLTGVTTPYTGDVVTAGMNASDGVVVLMTPDDLGQVRPEFLYESDGETERAPTGQPRMNVIFEAGMAIARDRERVVLVEMGVLRVMSDIAGLNTIQLTESVESRRQLGRRLRQAGLSVEMDHDRWRSAGALSLAPLDADMDAQ